MANPHEIKALPPVANPARREACRFDFRLFCETYLSQVFHQEWSDRQLAALEAIQYLVVADRGFVNEFDRMEGKTSLVMAASAWCGSYGHRRYLALITASISAASELIDLIKTQWMFNELLAADFPAACVPVRRHGAFAQLGQLQTLHGQPTKLHFTSYSIALAEVPGEASSGFRVTANAITGAIRGMCQRTEEEIIRPSVVLIDDPQTHDSIKSPTQVRSRVSITREHIAALGGPGHTVPVGQLLTRHGPNDYTAHFLDRPVSE